MSMCKLHSEFYRQQAKLDALLTRRCHTITEGKRRCASRKEPADR